VLSSAGLRRECVLYKEEGQLVFFFTNSVFVPPPLLNAVGFPGAFVRSPRCQAPWYDKGLDQRQVSSGFGSVREEISFPVPPRP